MKSPLLLLVILALSTACSATMSAQATHPATSTATATAANPSDPIPMKLSLSNPWTNVTVQLTIPGVSGSATEKSKTVEVPAQWGAYSTNVGQSRERKNYVLALTDPHTHRTCVVPASYTLGPSGVFYVSSDAGVVIYLADSSLTRVESYISLPEGGGGLDAAIAQFEAQYDNLKLDAHMRDALENNLIGLKSANPLYFYSTTGEVGGDEATWVVDAVDINDGVMHLAGHMVETKRTGIYWIDLEAKKVLKSVVDGQDMDLTTGKFYAVPVKK